ncbi:MAG TPA: glycoside hydrolase family 16 protein [Candidatus Limnocylindrales bacterium]|nr:glycoside hydrolase family 16 protein [Candidatus Limnocylindrales bacterium]
MQTSRERFLAVVWTAARAGALLLSLGFLMGIPAKAQNWGTPVWFDEFTGPQGTPIDTTKWTYDTGILNVNNEVEYYCAPNDTTHGCNPSAPNAYIDGSGHLIIQAIAQGPNPSTVPYSGSWTSARLITNGLESFQYGRVESLMSLPVGPGIWPAFWALGSNIGSVGWPTCGEIDYMENVPASAGLGPTIISSTLHGNSPTGVYGVGGKYTFPSGDVTGMHAYGAIWSPGMVQFYVDDPTKVFNVKTASDMTGGQVWAFDHPFFLLLNLAIGGVGSWPGPTDSSTPSPAIMTVDYVRIYKASAVPAPTFGTPPSITVKAGSVTGNTSSFTIGNTVGSGRTYLVCTTNAPKATCQLSTDDTMNAYTADFTTNSSAKVTVTVATTANSGGVTALLHWRGPIWGSVACMLVTVILLFVALQTSVQRLSRVSVVGIALFLAAGILLGCSGGGSSTPPPPSGGTTPGSYTITVNAYTLSGNGTNADATVSIPLTVN